MDKRIQWAITRLMSVVHPQFYGSVTLVFQAGKLQCIRTEMTEKADVD